MPLRRATQQQMTMSVLLDLQAALAAQIRHGVATPDGVVPAAGSLTKPQRLLVHQRHVRTSLTAVLRSRFPAVVKLVGDGFFAFAAAQFIAASPPADPRIARYGDGLPDFLARFGPARAYPWLPDVAHIENAAIAVTEAPICEPLDPARLAPIPAEHAADLVFAWNPSVRLVASDLPAAMLWRVAREGRVDTQIDMTNAGPTRLLIRRAADGVEARDLSPAEFAFRAAIANGSPLGEAAACAGSGFDLAGNLAALLAEGAVTDVLQKEARS
jgi:hypothetical protein